MGCKVMFFGIFSLLGAAFLGFSTNKGKTDSNWIYVKILFGGIFALGAIKAFLPTFFDVMLIVVPVCFVLYTIFDIIKNSKPTVDKKEEFRKKYGIPTSDQLDK